MQIKNRRLTDGREHSEAATGSGLLAGMEDGLSCRFISRAGVAEE